MTQSTNDAPPPQVIQTNPAIGERGGIHVYGADPFTPRPYVLGIHGGGWSAGDQTAYGDGRLGPLVERLGFSLVLATYRLCPEFPFPCAYDDLVHLLAWLRDNGASRGLDPERCVLFGASAGAHLAMLLATRAMKENRPMPGIRGVVNYCGIMDLPAQYAADNARGSKLVENFLGGPPESRQELYRAGSPICHIHALMPPVWMAHGTADIQVPIAQSRAMASALTAAGCDLSYLEARGLDHTMMEVGADGGDIEPHKLLFQDDVRRFMNRVLSS
ncbi:MAG: alpha/beta hydrolase fold domain-containing protein [bacterium]